MTPPFWLAGILGDKAERLAEICLVGQETKL